MSTKNESDDFIPIDEESTRDRLFNLKIKNCLKQRSTDQNGLDSKSQNDCRNDSSPKSADRSEKIIVAKNIGNSVTKFASNTSHNHHEVNSEEQFECVPAKIGKFKCSQNDLSDCKTTTHITNGSDVEMHSNGLTDDPMDLDENPAIESETKTIKISIEDVKTDFSEFADFALIFIYISDVENVNHQFYPKSFEITMHTKRFEHKSQKKVIETDSPFNLNLHVELQNEIIPERSTVKFTKKKIEIRLEKKAENRWGSIKECYLTANTKNDSLETIDIWRPCSQKIPIKPVELNGDIDKNVSDNKKKGITQLKYGFTGLENLGNTCYMNAVLQCLANTDPLREYFISDRYEKDINIANKLGTKGLFAKEFANVMKHLWKGDSSPFSPSKLKFLMSTKQSYFSGFSQNDAHELMSFLLDAIHEDLNNHFPSSPNDQNNNYNNNDDGDDEAMFDLDINECDSEQKYSEVSRLVKSKADKSWNQYRSHNNSFIIDLFGGQFKSRLTCHQCKKKAIIFEPFVSLPLPIPSPKLSINVIFFERDDSSDMCKSAKKFWLQIPPASTVNDLIKTMYQDNLIPTHRARLMRFINYESMPIKIYQGNWLLVDHFQQEAELSFRHNTNNPLLLFEIPDDDSNSSNFLELCIIQRKPVDYPMSYKISNQRIGYPFIVSIKKNRLSFSHFCEVICSYARFSVNAIRQCHYDSETNFRTNRFNIDSFRPSIDQLLQNQTQNGPSEHLVYHKTQQLSDNDSIAPFLLNTINFLDSQNECEILPHNVKSEDRLLGGDLSDENEDENTDDLIFLNDNLIDINEYYIAMDWITMENYQRIPFAVRLNQTTRNIREVRIEDQDNVNEISLLDCFKLFVEPEVLGAQNSWHCPNCKEPREASKQLSFWRLPQILVLQLKRFKRGIHSHEKISCPIYFPLQGLEFRDLVDFRFDDESIIKESIYDLYGVVNHQGIPSYGHYFAYARQSHEKNGWKICDDCTVESINENGISQNMAYLLFYKKRENINNTTGI
ncbi:hypothetical protein NH340_JMT06754 [Sarcoptes scabiei]|nr:hypothetical protein NH340_JMT06754 [Sarcoptes scabiei]